MIVTLNWLKEFASIPADANDEKSIRDLVDIFNSLGLVIDSFHYYAKGIEGIRVSKVLKIEPIKGADKIRLITTDIGQEIPVMVVCGAWNFEAGDYVPYAPIGTILPNKLEIKERTMRGVTSYGMLCSANEIDLVSEQNGLMLLDATDQDVGKSLVSVFNIDPDVIFDIETEGNRPDALSVIGIARDLCAKYDLELRDAAVVAIQDNELSIEQVIGDQMTVDQIQVDIEDPKMCGCFGLAEIDNVSVGKSGFLIQQRLLISNMRPLNNLVDISNYLMLERGQPTHPYDKDKLDHKRISVRVAKNNEKIETLDSQIRVLGQEVLGVSDLTSDIVITDGFKPIGIAGVMGGVSTEIDENTSKLALEVANFYPLAIARSSKRLNLKSEAQKRFERGVDPLGIEATVARYIQLLRENSESPLEIKGTKVLRPIKVEPKAVSLRLSRVRDILGIELDTERISKYIGPLGFKVLNINKVAADNETDIVMEIQIPTFRPDSEREIDVIEEIARIFGYEMIPKEFLRPPGVGSNHALNIIGRKIKSYFSSLGFHECWTSTFLPSNFQATLRIPGREVLLSLPLAKEEAVLRMSLAPGLAQAAVKNYRHKFKPVNLFEVGHIFRYYSEETPPLESVKAAGICFANDSNIDSAVKAVFEIERLANVRDFCLLNIADIDELDFSDRIGDHNFDTKDNEYTWEPLDISKLSTESLKESVRIFNPGKAALMMSGDKVLGYVGELNNIFSSVLDEEIKGAVYFEFDLVSLLNVDHGERRVLQSKYPEAEFDLAFVVNRNVDAAKVKSCIEDSLTDYIRHIWLFDVFTGNPLSYDEKSLAFKVRVANPTSTLSESDIAKIRAKIIENAATAVKARLR